MSNTQNTPTTVKLLAQDGTLYTPLDAIIDKSAREWAESSPWDGPKDPILMVQYPGGDYDSIKWPKPNEKNLRSALFDARETGMIPDVREVILPNGKTFVIDA